MGYEFLLILGEKGEVLKKCEDCIIHIIAGDLHNSILVNVEDGYQTMDNFFFVDEESGIIRELDFDKFMSVQSLTRNEKYFVLVDRDSANC